jgi:toxin ParE1/3/4
VIPYSFHPEAESELADAALFYESRVTGLGRQFSAEVQRIIFLICEYPDAGAPVRLPVRRTLVDRFPYAIVYRHDPESVHILAVAHLRQRPGYWGRRQ